VVAQVVVFLLFGPHLSMLLRDDTRLLYLWRTRDAVLMLGAMFLLALAGVAIGELARWVNRPSLTRLFNHAFVVALGAGLLANLWYHTTRPVGYCLSRHGMEIWTLWMLLIGLVVYSLARPSFKLVLRARQLCLIISPAVPIVAAQLLLQDTYSQGMDPIPEGSSVEALPVSDSANAARPVYLFFFDEWCYQRTFENGALQPKFANLSKLADRSVVFHNARSPGCWTLESIPRTLFQTDLPVVVSDGRAGFQRDGRFIPSRKFESIFSVVGDRQYRTFMIGVYLPYRMLLGDQVDVCRSYCWFEYYRGENPLDHFIVHAFNATAYWTDPWSRFLRGKIGERVGHVEGLQIYGSLNRDIMEVIESQPGNTFAVFHYPLPHYPYLLNADGSYCGPEKGFMGSHRVYPGWEARFLEGYERNLAYLDRLIGRITAALKGNGKFDRSLLILTSDHKWGRDPENETEWPHETYRHVPLFVKLPGQDRSLEVTSLFETRNLGSLIAWALSADRGPAGLDRFLQRTLVSTAGPGPHRELQPK